MPGLRIGGAEREFIAIAILGRGESDVDDYWESNWLSVIVEAHAGGFSANFPSQVHADDFHRFRDSLAEVYRQVAGDAEFRTIDGLLTIRVCVGARGEVEVDGDIIDQPGDGNRLRFHLDLDQSFLESALSQLRQTVKEYPVVGRYEPPA